MGSPFFVSIRLNFFGFKLSRTARWQSVRSFLENLGHATPEEFFMQLLRRSVKNGGTSDDFNHYINN